MGCLHPTLQCLGPSYNPHSSSLLGHTLGGNRAWLEYLSPCHTVYDSQHQPGPVLAMVGI